MNIRRDKMYKEKKKLKPFNVKIGVYGGVSVDPKEFFADPEVRRKIKEMRDYDILGRKRSKLNRDEVNTMPSEMMMSDGFPAEDKNINMLHEMSTNEYEVMRIAECMCFNLYNNYTNQQEIISTILDSLEGKIYFDKGIPDGEEYYNKALWWSRQKARAVVKALYARAVDEVVGDTPKIKEKYLTDHSIQRQVLWNVYLIGFVVTDPNEEGEKNESQI